MASINGDVSDDLTVQASPAVGVGYQTEASDGLGMQLSTVVNHVSRIDVPDEFRMRADDLAVQIAQAAVAADGVGMASVLGTGLGYVLRDAFGIAQTTTTEATYHQTLTEAATLHDRLKRGYAVTLSDVAQLGATLSGQLGLQVQDGVGIAEVIAGAGFFRRDFTEAFRVDDSTYYGVSGLIADTVGVAATVQGNALFNQLLSDTVGVNGTIASAPLLLQVVASDEVEITATDAVQMLYDGRLDDTVQITAVYPSIGGSVTTWSLNTKTGALTEYADYAFNSFAQLDGRYIGASEDGLFELTGSTDDGANIIAELETGLAQMTGSRFTSFRAAYLAVRGGGRFVLRLETGDGKTYNYAVNADDMATTKVQLGKGLRARYFSFTLISAGQDFDLEALEFVPIAARRRV